MIWQAHELYVILPTPWATASPEAVALRNQLQLVLDAIPE